MLTLMAGWCGIPPQQLERDSNTAMKTPFSPLNGTQQRREYVMEGIEGMAGQPDGLGYGEHHFLDKAATTTLALLFRYIPPRALTLTHRRLDILYNTRDRASNGVVYGGLDNIHTTSFSCLDNPFVLKRGLVETALQHGALQQGVQMKEWKYAVHATKRPYETRDDMFISQ